MYKYLGVHKIRESVGKYVYVFRTVYENAELVELVWDFSPEESNKLSYSDGVWQIIYESDIPLDGMKYKYRIFKNGLSYCVSDPFAFCLDVDTGYSILKTYEDLKLNKSDRAFGFIEEADAPMNICGSDFVFSDQSGASDTKKHKNYYE